MRYIVAGPEVSEVVVIDPEIGGPLEYYRDVFIVDAPNRKTAKWAAYNEARRRKLKWYQDFGDGYQHPLKGVKVEEVPGESLDGWEEYYIDATSTVT